MSGSNSTSTPTGVTTPTPAPSTTSSSSSEPVLSDSSTSANSSPSTATPSESTTSSFSTSSFTTTSSSSSSSESTTSSESTSSTESSTSSEVSTTSSPTPTPSPDVIISIVTQTPTQSGQSVSTFFITSTKPPEQETTSSTPTTSSTSASGTAGLVAPGKESSGGGLTGGGRIAVATVVPIVAVALLVLAGLFFWRKRKQRKDAEELRRKEVEEYGYNPNSDPSFPAGAGAVASGNDGGYEMKEDGSSGYRGWGTTAVASSSGRKASTTLSGPSAGGVGMAYSDTSPNHEPVSDARSDNNLVDGRPLSTEDGALGAMGPSASQNRGDINRGPSNASSSYSAANRSDGSGDIPGAGGSSYNQYDTGNPYGDSAYGSPPGRAEMPGQPVIRDVQARRNTRIENPSHFPQQSAGISQNF